MSNLLYKVTPPRIDMTCAISNFWHTADWESSSTKPKDGYIKDDMLHVGDFDESSIHLFPLLDPFESEVLIKVTDTRRTRR